MINRERFAIIYNQYYSMIFFFVRSHLYSLEDAQDISANTFLNVWRYRDQFNPQRGQLKTWIFSIANNLMKNYYRDMEKKSSVEKDPQNKIDIISDFRNEPDYIVETKDLIQKALMVLNAQERYIIMCRYFLNADIEEISSTLGLSKGNVRVKTSRALHKMRKTIN